MIQSSRNHIKRAGETGREVTGLIEGTEKEAVGFVQNEVTVTTANREGRGQE